MFPLFEGMKNPNEFVFVQLPTKREIFGRTGQVAVTPNGVYTGDQPVKMGQDIGQRMEDFIQNAEIAATLVNTPQDTAEKDTAHQTVKQHENE